MQLDSTYAVRCGTLQLQDASSACEACMDIALQPRNLGSYLWTSVLPSVLNDFAFQPC